MLVRVSARFELARFRVIGIRLYKEIPIFDPPWETNIVREIMGKITVEGVKERRDFWFKLPLVFIRAKWPIRPELNPAS